MIQIQLLFLLEILLKTSCTQHPFILIQEPKSWTEAQLHCREKHLDLATVQSDQDRSYIQEEVNGMNLSDAWVGLYKDVSTWRWSFKNEVINYQKWDIWEPNMDSGQEACAFLKSSGRWHDADCQNLKYFLCYDENDMWKWKYIRTGMTWHDAQQYCRTHHTDLMMISDDAVNIILVSKIFWDGEAWIGLSRSFWQWSDQTQVSWPSMKWIAGQPDNGNEECAYVHNDGLIADDSCSVQHPFFCTQIRKKLFVRVAMKSGGPCNESAVMEAIEKKINQTLVDSGSIVIWRVQSDEKIFHEMENIEREMTTTNQICEK